MYLVRNQEDFCYPSIFYFCYPSIFYFRSPHIFNAKGRNTRTKGLPSFFLI